MHRVMGVPAKMLIIAGLVLVAAGLIFWLVSKTGLGHLPGDIVIQRRNFSLVFPIVTCILISAILTVLMWIFSRFRP